ncbi:MAG: dihydroxyacetone kinase subunit DhaK [Mycoplasmoidaceae bacterium]|nr:dihydroxyacetone kinase subunit DhaK [Mycoplasmoidaceae bacterium]
MKKFINNVDTIVDEMVEGIVYSNPDKLVKVPNYNVVCRKDFNKDHVALVSGGGSGHEPAHAGYVGYGMLSGAVAGPIFTSPTPDMVQAAINQLDSNKGTLLIIKSYTGDIMNFQIAAEMEKAMGKNVDYVVVDDDIALIENKNAAGKRGIAGTVFVHKIAGAKAESGAPLEEVKAVALKAIKNTATMGIGLDGCTVPAAGKRGFNLPDDEVEMGLGIHGEPGIAREKMKPADEFTQIVTDKIINYLQLQANDKVAVLINGLGATPLMELYVINKKVNEMLKDKNIKVVKNFVGNYMTSIDMPGMSISLIKLDDELEQLVCAKCETLAFNV